MIGERATKVGTGVCCGAHQVTVALKGDGMSKGMREVGTQARRWILRQKVGIQKFRVTTLRASM